MADGPAIRWQDKPPREHGGSEACGLACRGVWREVRGHADTNGTGRRGWHWQCDHLRCPAAAAAAGGGGANGR